MCDIGKNYRLQDIQLSKITWQFCDLAISRSEDRQLATSPTRQIRTGARVHFVRATRVSPPSPNAHGVRGFGGHPSLWLAIRSCERGERERRMVENTGLEPVTSWLQTRRSPS